MNIRDAVLCASCALLCLWGSAGCGSAKKAVAAEEGADISSADAKPGGEVATADLSDAADGLASLDGTSDDDATTSDLDDGDTDQPVNDATLPDIPGDCQKTCKKTATGLPKVCGPDGCGSVCGYCPGGKFCNKDGTACTEFCTKVCTTLAGKAMKCGDDSCGGQCGLCETGFNCGIDFLCHPNDCKPDCTGKVCGDDGCGKSCGDCAPSEFCTDAGACQKSPCAGIGPKGNCEGDMLLTCEGMGAAAKKVVKDCSLVPPEGFKTCGYDIPTQLNACIPKVCKGSCKLPDGTPKKCGDDGCGVSCGVCPANWGCPAGKCEPKAGASCGGLITPQGQCDGDTWVYCSGNGTIAMVKCVLPETCKWDGSSAFTCMQ